MNSRGRLVGSLGTLSLAITVTVSACGESSGVAGNSAESATPQVQLIVLAGRGTQGDTVAALVMARYEPGSAPIVADGRVQWNSQELELLGQAETNHIVLLNPSGAPDGDIGWIAVSGKGLPERWMELRFRRRQDGSASSLRLEVHSMVDADLRVRTMAAPIRPVARPETPGSESVSLLSVGDWARRFGETVPASLREFAIAGDARIYGDVNLNQLVNSTDVAGIANVAVGNISLLTAENRDYAIAANVAPFNLPGLGEATDPLPPGRGGDGSYVVNSTDVAVIANEAVGNDQPVAGEVIPGRTVSTNRVIVADSILANRTFFRDSVYEIRGTVIVGNPAVGDVTLTIQAGTLIEGDAATRGTLVIRRGANLIAIGTRLEPIVFTCTSTLKTPGCWGGVVINGFSVLNNGSTGDDGTVGFPTKQGPGNTGRYGGTLVDDSSGVVRYARIEYAGAHPAGTGQAVGGLRLLAVGARTRIDTVQVRESLGDGVYVGGGTARLRNVVLTNNRLDGLSWEDGWQGAAQFLIVQLGTESRHGLRGANWLVNPNAGPRSAPILSNLTIVGPPNGTSGNAVLLEAGSGGRIFNAIVERAAAIGFDVSGAASCAVGGDSLDLRASIFFNAPGADFSDDSDCLDEVAFALTPARGNRILSAGLLAPLVSAAPDFRITSAGAALTGYQQPPSVVGEPFFDLTALYIGAVGPANTFGSNVPWYAGWTRGW